jgi:hypothetical protein
MTTHRQATASEELCAAISRAASSALLRIGEAYRERGLLHHALTPYLKIVACYPDSESAQGAVDRLVTIAEAFEERGHPHMAMSVYARLERAARFQRWNGHRLTPEGRIL